MPDEFWARPTPPEDLRFGVFAVVETFYEIEVDAPTSGDAAQLVGEMIRTGDHQAMVVSGPTIGRLVVTRVPKPGPSPDPVKRRTDRRRNS